MKVTCPICDSLNIKNIRKVYDFNYPDGIKVKVGYDKVKKCHDCKEEFILCGKGEPDIFAIAHSAHKVGMNEGSTRKEYGLEDK